MGDEVMTSRGLQILKRTQVPRPVVKLLDACKINVPIEPPLKNLINKSCKACCNNRRAHALVAHTRIILRVSIGQPGIDTAHCSQ
jgi:hypothetical protein